MKCTIIIKYVHDTNSRKHTIIHAREEQRLYFLTVTVRDNFR